MLEDLYNVRITIDDIKVPEESHCPETSADECQFQVSGSITL